MTSRTDILLNYILNTVKNIDRGYKDFYGKLGLKEFTFCDLGTYTDYSSNNMDQKSMRLSNEEEKFCTDLIKKILEELDYTVTVINSDVLKVSK